ncbi:MAG: hypothetical protein Q9223_007631, partial [Gallowayella weberi]
MVSLNRKYFNDDPCTITIAGKRLYVVTLPQHVAEVYRSASSLSHNPSVRNLHESFGMSPVGVEKMWEVPMAHENHVSPAGRKRLMDRSRDFHRLQLFPGRQLDDLNAGFITRIEHGTTWNSIPQPCILSSTADEMVVSLYKWCGYVLVDAASRGFYGDALVDTSPQIVRDFLELDKQSWMLFYQYPSFLAKAMTAPRERITQAFDRYIALHSEKKKDAAPYTKALAAEQTDAGVSTRDGAIAFQIFHFG